MEETAAAQARDDAADALPAPVRQAPPSPFRADGIAIAPPPAVERSAAATRALESAGQWLDLVAASGLSGPSRELAANAAFVSYRNGVLRLALPPGFEYLQSERSLAALAQTLAQALGSAPKIVVEAGQEAQAETLHARTDRQRGERQTAAEAAFMADPQVQHLLAQGARVVADSIRPFEE